jgi:hypothetical protein
MLAALFAPSVIGAIFREGASLFRDYQQGKITLEQLHTQLAVIAHQEATKVEQANAEMIAKTFGAFVDMAKHSLLIRWVYAIVVLSQTFVLFWNEWVVPYLVWMYGGAYPSSGELVQWAYALLVLLVGGGMVAIKKPK